MPGSEKLMFSCSECGRKFTWKPEIAGRKARCKCGSVIAVPKTAPVAPAPPPQVEDFDIPDDEPIQPAPMSATTPTSARSGATMPSAAATVASQIASRHVGDDDDTWKWWYYVLAGLAMVPIAFYQYFRLLDYESGEESRMGLKSFERMLYGIFGKWGVIAFLLAIGAVCITIGLYKWKGKREASAS